MSNDRVSYHRMSNDWWARWDRATCLVSGHSWLDRQDEWLGSSGQATTCIRCGATGTLPTRVRHRTTRTAGA